ncbi:jg14034 [Pararge aegeria aegeria]|uniref:Jg14034 protein n=1 Tax=Pararge aegeria aegeria TaxID=348720 RepID=A0A8S4R502_9NEOP|nr:jg14034 [Pararge aegeria aegeria]
MNEENNSTLSITPEKISEHSIKSASTSQDVEDGPARSNEDDTNLQCTSARIYKDSYKDDRELMFVIVDSNCESNPSSKEILINKKNVIVENTLKTTHKRNVIPVAMPCSSSDETNFILPQDGESREELEMIDINLQSENEIIIDQGSNETETESIVISYIRNKDAILDHKGLSTTRKKSAILENIPKMETIPEDKQFTLFSGQPRIQVSENSLDVYIPSYPGSPRSLSIAPRNSVEAIIWEEDPIIGKAVEFIHQDKDFLTAAEIGNHRLLDIYIRRGVDVQQIDHLGRNALHLAICLDNLRAVQVLLDAGVNPNIKDNLGMTPLSLSLMRRPSLTVAQLLFDHGARLMPRSDPMDTGLFIQFVMMCIPTSEEKEILKLLVEKGAIINDPRAPGGRQALHFAALSNNTSLIRILVSLGADLHLKNHRNEMAKQVAETFGCAEAYDLLCDLEDELSTSSSNYL